jgi:predicted regulator of Ras-like GTPase activity (Roadblock/LC7/MglB family)
VSLEEVQLERRKLIFVLEDIVRKCDLDALAVVTQKDAEEIAFFSEIDMNSDVFCTLAASTLDTATKVTSKLNHGAVTELVVIGDTGFTIMSPIGEEFILIGAGRDFFSMGKTILILREKVQYIPSSLVPKNSVSSKRKACSHFCRYDGLYCCVCARKADICELCKTSVKHKQLQAEKQKAVYNDSELTRLSETTPEKKFVSKIKSQEELKAQTEQLFGK